MTKKKWIYFVNYIPIYSYFSNFGIRIYKIITKRRRRGKNSDFDRLFWARVHIIQLSYVHILSICGCYQFPNGNIPNSVLQSTASLYIPYRRTVFTPRLVGKHQKLVTFERSEFICSRVSTKDEIRSFGSFSRQWPLTRLNKSHLVYIRR